MGPQRLLVFTGEGKGKTTAALGMALRACGHGQRVLIIQFIKADSSTGELAGIRHLPTVTVMQVGLGFVPPSSSPRYAEHRDAAKTGIRRALEAFQANAHELFVLDEVCTAVAKGLLEESEVLAAVQAAPRESCVVLTGRGATAGLLDHADTVTEMRCIKHAYECGKPAGKGIEV